MMLINPGSMNVATTKAMPLVVPKLLSLIVSVAATLHAFPTHLLVIQTSNLAIALDLVNVMIPICHISTTPVVTAKTQVQLNGLIVKYVIAPLVLKLPKILMKCAKLPTNKIYYNYFYHKPTFQFATTLQSGFSYHLSCWQ